MSSSVAFGPGSLELALPWSHERGERRRLLAVSSLIVPVFLWLAFVVSVTDLPERERAEEEALPPRLARLVSQPKPPPPPVEQAPEEQKVTEPAVAEPAEVPPPPRTPAAKPEPTEQAVRQAREKASRSGILAMDNELSRIRSLGQSVKLGGVDQPAVPEAPESAAAESDSLAARAALGQNSSGMNESELARQAAERELEARQRRELAVAEPAQTQQAPAQSAGRSREAMRQTMDQQKAAIYSIYNRELRRKPSLRGTVTPELVIEETGVVSGCTIIDSTLDAPALEQRICMRLRLVDFGTNPGSGTTRLRYPIELVSG